MYRIEFTDPDDPMGMPGTTTVEHYSELFEELYELMVRNNGYDVTHVEIWKD